MIKSAHPNQTPIHRILVFSHLEMLGDGIMKIPFVKELRRQFPYSHISWMTGRETTVFNTLLKDIVAPYIDKVYSKTGLGIGASRSRVAPWLEVLDEPFYDIIIDTSHKFSPTRMLKRVPHGLFISNTWHYFFSDRRPPWGTPHSERAWQQTFDLLKLFAPQPPIFDPHIPVPALYTQLAQTLMAPALATGKKIVLLTLGSGHPGKTWPLDNCIALYKELASDAILPVFMAGPYEAPLVPKLKQIFPEALFPLQETDDTSPYVTLACGRLADFSVVNDAGIGHLLGISHTPMVVLYGPTHAAKYLPIGTGVTALEANKFVAQSRLMRDVPVSAVAQAVRSGLGM